MHRLTLFALALFGSAPLAAQTVYVAPTVDNMVATTEESAGPQPAHVLYVQNRSSVPIVVFGISLTDCENIRQWCAGRGTNIRIGAGERRSVGRVEPKMPDRAWNYRWTYSFHPDSADARFIAALRESGMLAETPPAPRPAPDSQVSTFMTPVSSPHVDAAVPAGDATSGAALGPLVSSTDVDGMARAVSAIAPTRQFMVTNKSPYPIVVYSFNLATCLNVKQVCGRTPIDVRIPAKATRQIARVDAQDRARRYSYDWTYDWKLDTADAKVAEALRLRGLREGTLGDARNLLRQPERPAGSRPARDSFRFKVARESILGSTQVKGGVVRATGACIDPVELASRERDTAIRSVVDVPPTMAPGSIVLPTVPAELRETVQGEARVMVRWAVDESGATIPGSVDVLESPSGLLSVRVCGAVLAAHLTPARDASGQAVSSWVQAPLRIVP